MGSSFCPTCWATRAESGTALTPADCGFEGVYYPGYGYPEAHPHYIEYLRRLGLAGFVLREQRYSGGSGAGTGPLLTAVQEGEL